MAPNNHTGTSDPPSGEIISQSWRSTKYIEYMNNDDILIFVHTRHFVLAKFFLSCSLTEPCMFLEEAVFPDIQG